MNRVVIARAGACVALGFLATSALANFSFGVSLGRSAWEATLYGLVGIFAVAMNALAPFFLSWSLAAMRRTTSAAIVFVWALCLAYSTTSALGFAAQNRESVALGQQMARESYDDTRRELLDLEARRVNALPKDRARLDSKIDDARKRLTSYRTSKPTATDAQSSFLSMMSLGILEPHQMRVALVALFALMVEVCATLGLFVALSHSFSTAPSRPTQWVPKEATK